jgi:hypothetical protein
MHAEPYLGRAWLQMIAQGLARDNRKFEPFMVRIPRCGRLTAYSSVTIPLLLQPRFDRELLYWAVYYVQDVRA